jgi:hypothetical protein
MLDKTEASVCGIEFTPTKSSVFDVWTPDGAHCIVAQKNSVWIHRWVKDASEAEARARKLDDEGHDVYFAMASFGDTSLGRKQVNVISLACLFVDIDCGTGKPYRDAAEAHQALLDLVACGKFPEPSAIVWSGTGLHVYWRLARPLPIWEWAPIAKQFKAYCTAMGLHIDPARTADAASMLRVPGTHNRKSEPVLVTAEFSDAVIDPDDFSRLMAAKGGASPGLDPEALLDQRSYPPAYIDPIVAGCAQMAHVLLLGGAVPEPLWRSAVSILLRCIDGDRLIHDWSRGDPRYDPEETQRKAKLTKGPHTCDQFQSVGEPNLCEVCPNRERIRSPITLGTQSRSGSNTIEAPNFRNIAPFVWRPPSEIPRRQWVYGNHLIRGFVSATIAPGGTGKSSMALLDAIAMATGRNLTGHQPHGRYRVLYWNGEDPLEELERRIAAICLHYGICSADIGERLYIASGRDHPIIIAFNAR